MDGLELGEGSIAVLLVMKSIGVAYIILCQQMPRAKQLVVLQVKRPRSFIVFAESGSLSKLGVLAGCPGILEGFVRVL